MANSISDRSKMKEMKKNGSLSLSESARFFRQSKRALFLEALFAK